MNVGEADDEVEKVECNISRPKGVRFVTKPPDLRILPRREPFDPSSILGRTNRDELLSLLIDDSLRGSRCAAQYSDS